MYRMLALLSIIVSQLSISGVSQGVDQAPSPQVIAAAQASFHEYDSGSSFDYAISTTSAPTQPITIARSFDPSPGGSLSPTRSAYPNPHIKRMVMNADFVGKVTILKSWSYPTASNSFVFTIYLVHIDDVAVSDGVAAKAGQYIYVTRAGGQVDYKGHPVLAIDPHFDLFPIGDTYIFFGKSIGMALYKVNSDGSLQENNNLVQEANKRNAHIAIYNGRDAKSILGEAFSAWQELPPRTSRGAK